MEVRFEGVMTFVIRPDRVDVLIPNAEPGLAADQNYEDGDPGGPHWAWLTKPGPGSALPYTAREKLYGTKLTVGTGGRPDVANLAVLDIGPIVRAAAGSATIVPRDNSTYPPDAAYTATKVTLFGGRFVDPFGRDDYNHVLIAQDGTASSISKPAETMVWEAPMGVTTIAMELANGTARTITPGDWCVISNLDAPTPEAFQADPSPTNPIGLYDEHFRWVYRVFGIPASLWRHAAGGGAGWKLPRPRVESRVPSPGGATPITSKCKGASIAIG